MPPFEFERSIFVLPPGDDEAAPIDWATQLVLQSKEESYEKGRRSYRLSRLAIGDSKFLTDLLIEVSPDEKIVIPVDIDGATLHYVVSFLENHVGGMNASAPVPKPLPRDLFELGVLSPFDQAFLLTDLIVGGDVSQHGLLLSTLQAAHYLGAQRLLDITAAALGNIMRSRDVEEVRAIFKIEQDQSPEELARIEEGNRKYRELMNA